MNVISEYGDPVTFLVKPYMDCSSFEADETRSEKTSVVGLSFLHVFRFVVRRLRTTTSLLGGTSEEVLMRL